MAGGKYRPEWLDASMFIPSDGWVYMPRDRVVLDAGHRNAAQKRTPVVARVFDAPAGPVLAAGPDLRRALELIARGAQCGRPASELGEIAENSLKQLQRDAIEAIEQDPPAA